MTDFLAIHGYAIPFGQTVLIDGDFECIERGAFRQMLEGSVLNVSLRWDTHDDDAPELAHTNQNSLQLFEDSYGLGFCAAFDMQNSERGLGDNWARLQNMVRRIRPHDQCSVGAFSFESKVEPYCGLLRRRVTRATIGHISLVNDGAYGNLTGVWLSHSSLSNAPLRIRNLSEKWDTGWQAALARKPAPPAERLPTAAPRERRERDIRALYECGFSGEQIAQLEQRKPPFDRGRTGGGGLMGRGPITSLHHSFATIKKSENGKRHV